MTGYRPDEMFPDARSPLEADASSAIRRRRIILHLASSIGELADIRDTAVGEDHAAKLLAVLAAVDHGWGAYLPRDKGDPMDIVNRFIESNNPGPVGTSFSPIVGGDYDMALVILVRIAFEYRRYLRQDADKHLVDRLLTQRGPFDPEQLNKSVAGLFSFQETENHVMMISASRYLTNQLLGLDNSGMSQFLLRSLQNFLRNDFKEYNSRPYQRLTVHAITLLADHSVEEPVRLAARMVLDYLTAKFAVSSNGLRRHVPFRRLNEATDTDGLFDTQADREQPRFLALTGLQTLYRLGDPTLSSLDFASATVVPAVLSSYRPPLPMINLMMVNEGKEYYQRFHHDGFEIFASTRDFLISAGGIWMEGPYGHGPFGLFGSSDDSIPMPTVVMPSETGVSVSGLVRVAGTPRPGSGGAVVGGILGGLGGAASGALVSFGFAGPIAVAVGIVGGVLGFLGGFKVGANADASTDRHRINTGVAPGFACGLNITVPGYLDLARDIRTKGALVLVDCTTLSSPEQHYLAVRRDTSDSNRDPVGWIAVASAAKLTFDEFESRILAGGGADTVTVNGLHHLGPTPIPRVSFTPGGDPNDRFLWPIRGPLGEWINLGSLPLAVGDVMNSENHDGVIHIDQPIFDILKRTNALTRSVRTELEHHGIKPPTGLRTALKVFPDTPARGSISTRTSIVGIAAIQARHISMRLSLRTETARRSISLATGLRGAMRDVAGLPPEARRSTRTFLTVLRRRLTLDARLALDSGPRRISPHYTAREVAVLFRADASQGIRQLFAFQRGLTEIRLSQFVEHPGGRFTVREACRLLNADPGAGMLRLFPAQVAHRVTEHRMSTLLRET